MADMNQCNFTGRLGRDPEVRFLPDGTASCNASIAVGKKWKDKETQEMKEVTTWVPLSFYGKIAELLGKYAAKGSQIRVTGEFAVRKYTPQGGEEKTITEIKVQDLQLLGGRPEGAGGGGQAPASRAAAPASAPRQAAAARPATGFNDMDDDIPF